MALNLEKRVYEERLLTVDLRPAMRDVDTLAGIDGTSATGPAGSTAVTIDQASFIGDQLTFRARGGSPGEYVIRIRFNTTAPGAQTQRLEGVVGLTVRP